MATMNGAKSRLDSIKLPANMSRHSDIMFAVGAVMVIMMLVIPLPSLVLDFLLIVNIIVSLLILLMVLSIKSANDFSVFPSVLLVMTAFRLALNVSTTRAILTEGANFNGKVITAFADFVVGGNIVVGVVIFIILIIVQFIVITKGATRVSEVAARFALDSMPSKMMAVESELQAGAITDKEAEEKRRKIRGESDFYGTMDGASKFVQGDVIAGIIITVINIVGGLIIGMTMRGEPFTQAVNAYTRFTVGDGLVSQIPSFFMSFATGLLVTRSSSEDNLSTQIAVQVFAKPKNLFIGAGFAFFLMLLPGFPKIALFVIALALFLAGYALKKEQQELGLNEDGTTEFQKAVAASVSEIMGWFDDDADANAYASSLGTPTLQKVFEQKYIAQSVDEQVETYNDLRRVKAMGESYIVLTNPYNTQGGVNRFPERLPYGNSSVLSNPNISSVYGDGYYIYSEKTWINGGK